MASFQHVFHRLLKVLARFGDVRELQSAQRAILYAKAPPTETVHLLHFGNLCTGLSEPSSGGLLAAYVCMGFRPPARTGRATELCRPLVRASSQEEQAAKQYRRAGGRPGTSWRHFLLAFMVFVARSVKRAAVCRLNSPTCGRRSRTWVLVHWSRH